MTEHFDPHRYKVQERAGFNRIAGRYGEGTGPRASLAEDLAAHRADDGYRLDALTLVARAQV